jgi:3-phytase
MRRRSAVTLAAITAFAALPAATLAQAPDAEISVIPALVETTPVPGDGATGAAFWVHPDDPTRSVLIGGDENGGIGVYGLDGTELQYLAEGPLKSVDLRYGVLVGADRVDLVVASLEDQRQVRFYRMDPETRQLVGLGDVAISIPGDGVCLYDSPFTNRLFVVVTSETGVVEQWQLEGEDGTLTGRLARTMPVGSEISSCVVDDERGVLFLSEEEVGIWRYGAEPEAGIARQLVDVGQQHLASGNLLEQAEGLTIVAYPDGAGYLLAANEKADAINVYERGGDQAYLGTFKVGEGDGVDRVTEPGGIAVLPVPLGEAYPAGAIAMSDDTNTDPDDDKSFKIASWGAALEALGLPAEPSPLDARREVVIAGRDRIPSVVATAETTPVIKGLDAADDPAIYVHPTDPTLNAIIGTDKTGALVVYGFDGAIRQELPIGRVNNVDVRDGLVIGGVPRTVVVTDNRSDNSLYLYLVDEATGMLVEAHAAPIVSDVNEVYGLCVGQDPATGTTWAIVNSSDTGEVEQYLLGDAGDGTVSAERVREFVVGSQTEGCVVDDAAGVLYIGEELVGVWRYPLDPAAGDERVAVDLVEDGRLVADVEGLALIAREDGTGYLLVSSQGNSTFAVYERGGDNAYVGSFRIVDGEGIDAVSGTDGIDARLAGLPAPFDGGLFVAQDDLNRQPDDNQNFKLVRWADIAAALGVE